MGSIIMLYFNYILGTISEKNMKTVDLDLDLKRTFSFCIVISKKNPCIWCAKTT